jgi:hypothetical protein
MHVCPMVTVLVPHVGQAGGGHSDGEILRRLYEMLDREGRPGKSKGNG